MQTISVDEAIKSLEAAIPNCDYDMSDTQVKYWCREAEKEIRAILERLQADHAVPMTTRKVFYKLVLNFYEETMNITGYEEFQRRLAFLPEQPTN